MTRIQSDQTTALLNTDAPPRAAAMIVTIYGDVVDPRGGELWMGDLIDICARIGLSESLVRTAVSRLVAAGQLKGTRQGRRSYYSLTEAARVEYRAAAERIYGPPTHARGWTWLIAPTNPEAATAAGFIPISNTLWLAPGRQTNGQAGGTIMTASPHGDTRALARLAARHWLVDTHARAYRQVIERYNDLPRLHDQDLTPDAALILRLHLVHDYRGALLRDPGLPIEALPADWPAQEARALFSRLYTLLTPLAETAIAGRFTSRSGPLEATTDMSAARLDQLGG